MPRVNEAFRPVIPAALAGFQQFHGEHRLRTYARSRKKARVYSPEPPFRASLCCFRGPSRRRIVGRKPTAASLLALTRLSRDIGDIQAKIRWSLEWQNGSRTK
jgi:hypothetical protein